MHAISSYRGNRPTYTHKQTHRQDRLQYTVPLSLVRSVNIENGILLYAAMDIGCKKSWKFEISIFNSTDFTAI